MNLVVFGPPGIGKGTSSELLSKQLKIPKISTGDILRAEMNAGTKLGKQVKDIVNSGNLVPDELVIKVFKSRISQKDCANGFITDGFPRTVKQAEALDKICKIDSVFNLLATHESLMKRIIGRRLCAKCGASYNVNISRFKPKKKDTCDSCGGILESRKDQEPEIVEQRLKVYETQTKPVISYYKKQKKLHDIDAEGMPEDIIKEISRILNAG